MLLLPSLAASAQSQLETFVLTEAGNTNGAAGCGISSSPPPVAAFFLGGVFIPVPGVAFCGLAGSMNSKVDAVGPLSDALSLSSAGTFSSSAGSRYGRLHATSHAAGGATVSYMAAEAMTLAREVFTFTSPSVANGATGSVQFLTTVSGGLSTVTSPGPGSPTSDVEIYYRVNGVGPTLLMRAQAVGSTSPPFFTWNGFNGPLTGFTLTPGALSGSDVVRTAPIPIVFGTAVTFHLGLLTYASGPTASSTIDSAFEVKLTGIEVRNAANQLVTNFAVASGSGTAYDSGGVVLPALPALSYPALLGVAALLVIAGIREARTRHGRRAANLPSASELAGECADAQP